MIYPNSKELGLRGESKRIYDMMVQAGAGSKAKHFDNGSGYAREYGVIIVDANGKEIGGCHPATVGALKRKGILYLSGYETIYDLYELLRVPMPCSSKLS